jgi:hypothetical protein
MRIPCGTSLVIALVLALCSPAAAADFCVAGPAGCTGTAVPQAQLQAQLTAAQSNGTDDRVFLGPVTFTGAYTYASPERVDILGSGTATTVFAAQGNPALTLSGNPGSTVSDAGFDIVANGAAAVHVTQGEARRIAVTQHAGTTTGFGGVALKDGATLSHSTVTVNGQSGIGVNVVSGGGAVLDSTVASKYAAVVSGGGPVTVRRDRLLAPIGVDAVGGSTTVRDTLIDTRGHGLGVAVGLFVTSSAAPPVTLAADGVTIVGDDATSATTIGASVHALAGATTAIDLRNAVIDGMGVPLRRSAAVGGVANLSSAYTDHGDPVTPKIESGPGALVEEHRLQVAPGFVDPAAGDFRLRADSALVESGDPAATGETDLGGGSRLDDGDGDCVGRRDVGAFEYQRLTPKAVAGAAAGPATAGTPVGFSAAGSCDPEPGDALAFDWRFDDGATATGATVAHAFTTAGAHTATLTATDPAGHAAAATTTVTVGAAVDTAAPVLTSLRVPRRIARGRALPRMTGNRRAQAIRFRLSEPAQVRLRFVRRGGSSAAAAGKRLRVDARAGGNRLRFAGRLARHSRLRLGRYRVTVTATDAAGNRSRPVTRRLRLVD